MIFLLNDLSCSSFRSAANAYLVRAANNFPHRCCGDGTRLLASSFVTSQQSGSGYKKHIKSKAATKNGRQFFAQRVQSFCREPAMKWVTGAARARFLAAFARSKAVPRRREPPCRRGFALKNSVLHAGSLLGGLHAGHLRPCHHRRADESGANNGQYPLPCRLMLSATRSRWGQRLGQRKAAHQKRNL